MYMQNIGHFKYVDTNIYKKYREKYLPPMIRHLFIAESPPAFRGMTPEAYFYFHFVPKADTLFYTLIKAIYNLDFEKHSHTRTDILSRFANDGYYLIDAVEYPINKNSSWHNVSNVERQRIIKTNQPIFDAHLHTLIAKGSLAASTKSILIKETVFKSYHNHALLNVQNRISIGFPQYIKDRKMIELIRELL
jgi:hypothetical protein